MNETCRPGTEYFFRVGTERQNAMDSLLVQSTYHTEKEGMSGTFLPYRMRSDWTVTGVLFLCFILLSYVLANGRKHLLQQARNFTTSKERASLFDDTTPSDIRYTVALLFLTCILAGFCVYDYFSDHNALLFRVLPHELLLGIYMACMFLAFGLKWFLYSFVNWTFFDTSKNVIWMDAYFTVVMGAGFLLFPVVLLIVYFDLSTQITLFVVGFVIIFAKILLLYKCIHNFFNKIHGVFHFILYFCAVEIIPVFLLWKGMMIMNNMLIFKFLVH